MTKRRILITGACGNIGSQLLPVLSDRYDLTLLDLTNRDRHGNKVPGVIKVDLCKRMWRYKRYFEGIDTVVHLAYVRTGTRDFPDELANITMVYHVLRVAYDCHARRVVVAGSNHASDWHEELWRTGPLEGDPDGLPLSHNFYGWAKASCEHMGFVFATGFYGRKLQNVHLRIGAAREIDARTYTDMNRLDRDLRAYVSPRDLRQLVVKSIETELIENEDGVPWQVFYGVSGNRRRYWSIRNAREVVGYLPEDDAEIKFAESVAVLESRR